MRRQRAQPWLLIKVGRGAREERGEERGADHGKLYVEPPVPWTLGLEQPPEPTEEGGNKTRDECVWVGKLCGRVGAQGKRGNQYAFPILMPCLYAVNLLPAISFLLFFFWGRGREMIKRGGEGGGFEEHLLSFLDEQIAPLLYVPTPPSCLT